MKLKVINIFLLLGAVFALISTCDAQSFDNFYFKEAQPRKEESLTRFPSTLRGLYKSDLDTVKRLQITADSIFIELPMVQYATFDELAKKKYIFRDSVVVKPNGVELPAIQKNDTLYFVDYAKSVLFVIDEAHVLKLADDKYVCSKKMAEDKWDCFLIYKENAKICIAYFDFDKKIQEIEENKKVEKIKNDTENYYLTNLKKKDLIKLIDKNYFPRKQYFHKRFDWQ